jgi:hypothetical protein
MATLQVGGAVRARRLTAWCAQVGAGDGAEDVLRHAVSGCSVIFEFA